jgi:hypothetical protein
VVEEQLDLLNVRHGRILVLVQRGAVLVAAALSVAARLRLASAPLRRSTSRSIECFACSRRFLRACIHCCLRLLRSRFASAAASRRCVSRLRTSFRSLSTQWSHTRPSLRSATAAPGPSIASAPRVPLGAPLPSPPDAPPPPPPPQVLSAAIKGIFSPSSNSLQTFRFHRNIYIRPELQYSGRRRY